VTNGERLTLPPIGLHHTGKPLKITTGGNLNQRLSKQYVNARLIVADETYHLASTPFQIILRGILALVAPFRYILRHKIDCDSWSSAVYGLARILYLCMPWQRAESIAVAELHYRTGNAYSHAINLIITDKELITFDPQRPYVNATVIPERVYFIRV
jgi:hypothetical protein